MTAQEGESGATEARGADGTRDKGGLGQKPEPAYELLRFVDAEVQCGQAGCPGKLRTQPLHACDPSSCETVSCCA